MTPEQAEAVSSFFGNFEEAMMGVRRHAGHSLSKAGRCVYCSCGLRLGQGSVTRMRKAGREMRAKERQSGPEVSEDNGLF